MVLETIKLQTESLLSMCAVCISDRSGGQIALSIIIAALVLLAIANWAWKKYSKNTEEISIEK